MEFYLSSFHNISFKIEVTDYIPRRQAPFTSNPDDPGYSDPGDDEEIDFGVWFVLDDGKDGELLVPIPDVMYEYIYDEVLYNFKRNNKIDD